MIVLLVLCYSPATAQVSMTAPKQWKSGFPVDLDPVGLGSNPNIREAVRREVLDTKTVEIIAQSVQITDHDKTLFLVAPDPGEGVWLYMLRDEWTDGCRRFATQLISYVQARLDGHTRNFLLAGLTNRPDIAAIPDPDLRILATNYPVLPVDGFQKAESGTRTNKAGQVVSRSMTTTLVDGNLVTQTNVHVPAIDEVCRWIAYDLVDGNIAWRYVLTFKADGNLDHIDSRKFDSKEIDPNFRRVFEEVDSAVTKEMKQNGTHEQFGSVHAYWRLKKEKLKARGIEWNSPAELNRGTHFD
jgi:hypothetical protein